MAKKIESIYKSWDDVDNALKKLGELNIQKTRLEEFQTLKTNEIKAETAKMAAPVLVQIKDIEKNIERFVSARKSEFLKTRSKKLNFGTIAFKLTKKVCCSCVADAIKSLRVLNLDFCIRTKSELDKEQLLECDEKILEKAGITIKTEDKLRIEPNVLKLAALAEEV